MNQFILEYGSILDQGTIYFTDSLYILPHKGASILSPGPSNFSDHFTTTMVDIATTEAWLLIIAPSGDEPYICAESSG